MRVWINFKLLRSKLKFDEVLGLYGVKVNRKGDQHQGPCPLPGHAGKRESDCFSANLERGIFQCFGCEAGGNVLEFAALMSRVDPTDGQALRKVALELQTRFFPEGLSTRTERSPQSQPSEPGSRDGLPVVVNAPLDFALKGLDPRHPYLLGRGFNESTIAHFGVGFCARGMLKNQVAVPLHDGAGNLVGYAGRLARDDETVKKDRGYTFPASRERNGTILKFDRSALLYNAHRIAAPCDDLVVVQWFSAVWWLHQCGFPSTVGLMGSECSGIRTDLIVAQVKPSGRIWLITEGDKAGQELSQVLVPEIARERFVRLINLKDGSRPTDLSSAELTRLLTF